MYIYKKLDTCPKCNKGFPGDFTRKEDNLEIWCGYCDYKISIPVSETLIYFSPESSGCDFDAIVRAEGNIIKTYTITDTHKVV